MDNPYGAKLPPSLVTLENGFTFNNDMDDSDLSSLNTTPRKQEQRKRTVLTPDQIEEADLGLRFSKANRDPFNRRSFEESKTTQRKMHSWDRPTTEETSSMVDNQKDPPLQVVQVAGERAQRDGPDPRVTNDQENNTATRGRDRDQKLRDRKEKYRRMASPSSRRIRPSGGLLNSWKKKAEDRKEAASRVKPWFVPAIGDERPHDEREEEDEEQEEQDDDVSPMRAKNHTFEESKDDDAKEEETKEPPKEEAEPPKEAAEPPKKASPALTTGSDEKRKNRSIVSLKNKFVVERSVSPSANVDMYGCPIFHVDSDGSGEDLTETKAKLDKLDTEIAQEENTADSIKAMLSSASFFSKSAAQTLADASAGSAKLLGNAAQGVEELVLGPVEEGDESGFMSSYESDATPPPPPRPRGRSPTAFADSTNCAAKRIQDDSVAETSSFVLDDKSEVDVPTVLEVSSHYVLDDLAAMEKKANEPAEDAKDEVAVKDSDQKAIDISSESDLFVEDEKVTSIENEIDAKIEVMDTIHVKHEVERLESLHAQEALKAAVVEKSPVAVSDSNAAEHETEAVEATTANETAEAAPADEASEAAPATETAEDAPADKAMETASADETVEDAPADKSLEAAPADEASEATPADEAPEAPDETVEAAPAEEAFKTPETTRKQVLDSSVGVAVVTVAVTPEKEEIERDAGQLVIAAPNEPNEESSKDEEPEFPPTDDADVDMIDFDTVSVKTDGTPVRGNLNDSRDDPKKKEPKKKEAEKKPKVEAPVSPEAAPETPKTKASKKQAKKGSGKNKESPKVADRKDASTISKEPASSKPAMVKTLDDNNGIAKGDIVLSLLNANLKEANRAPKGADQVRDAILRMRDMRRRQEKVEMPVYEPEEAGSTETESLSKRSVLPVDVDDMRVVGAFENVKTLEEDAIEHLKHDEIEAALELYEEIITIYAEAFKETAKRRKKKDKNDHKAYIGAALHNIGILNLLRFDFEEALSYFDKAADNRKDHFGEGSVDHLGSLGKIALCHYAMNEYETAHKSLEQVLELSKNHLAGLTDFMQVAEVLNNLGCLSFMCGQSGSAMTMFKECLEIQTAMMKQSLYSGPRFAGQSTSLCISITRGNIGYVQMLTKNAGPAIVEFEASLMHQQMILGDGHDTLLCTMDHLAVANLLAKNKEEATKMLGRMLRAQLAAYGAADERCILTLSKLQLVQTEETDYLEKALDQLWDQHSTAASPPSKAARVAAAKKSNKMLKKLSFRKKAAKLNH